MPTYEYVCKKCKGSFDFFQSMKDDALQICPQEKCQRKTWGKGEVKRQLGSGAGLIFKGSGFYITDYRSQSYKDAAKSDSSSGSKETKSSESKSTASSDKPAATPAKPSTSSGSSSSSSSSKN